eukprot:1159109-Pelagomonas_calceolata.AAC.3
MSLLAHAVPPARPRRPPHQPLALRACALCGLGAPNRTPKRVLAVMSKARGSEGCLEILRTRELRTQQ